MLKVICEKCKETGFTASPEQTRCECGGRLRIFSNIEAKQELKKDKLNLIKLPTHPRYGWLI